MQYLSLPRTRLILATFLASGFLLYAFPEIDLAVSSLFYDGRFHQADAAWTKFLHVGIGWFLALAMAAVVATFAFNRFRRRDIGGIDGRKIVYLFAVLIIGAGLIVNSLLKDNFGRARPRDVAEFGGSRQFAPPFTITDECDKNCSFSCGDGAAGFFSLALAFALTRRRAVVAAAVGFGALVSLSRIATGAHFFSDAVVSFFVMLLVADALHFYLLVPRPVSVPGAVAPIPVALRSD
jgi:lipid A 4'-phosphatase